MIGDDDYEICGEIGSSITSLWTRTDCLWGQSAGWQSKEARAEKTEILLS